MVTIKFLAMWCSAMAVGPSAFELEAQDECSIPAGTKVQVILGEDEERTYAAQMGKDGIIRIKGGK